MAHTPRKVTIDARVKPTVKTPLWAKVAGSLVLVWVLAVVGIPITWGLAWLLTHWPS